MPEILQFGPFMIKSDWLLLFISGYIGYFFVQREIKKSEYHDRPLLDKTINTMLIVFLCWKLSPILSNPSILWRNPLGLIILPGSIYGIWLGTAIAAVYLIRTLRRMNVAALYYTDLLTSGLVSMIFVYQLLGWRYGSLTSLPWGISIEDPAFKYHPVNVYTLLVTLPMLFWAYRNRNTIGEGKISLNFLSYYMAGLMLVSLVKMKVNLIFGLSREQVVYLLLMILGFVLPAILQKYQGENTSVKEGKDTPNDADRVLPSDPGNVAFNEIRPENEGQKERTILSD